MTIMIIISNFQYLKVPGFWGEGMEILLDRKRFI